MPKCTSCGADLAAGSRYCPRCGAKSGADATGAAGPVVPPGPGAAALAPSLTATSPSTLPPLAHHAPFDPGTRLGPRYRIVAFLGRGGMGEVYRADDLELNQPVALKFLPGRVHANSLELDQLRREVRVAREIAHPNVCRTYDIASVDGHVFLVMEYIGGEDLASALRRMGRPSRDKAVEIARQLCLGLGAAHERGILHRDLKPANVMIDDRGRVRITDFGLAGLEEELAGRGDGGGTPAYMAPEQLAGGAASVQSDLYSLGLVLYEVFTGKRAFEGRAPLKRGSDSSPRSPSTLAPDIDPAVERVILRCLESDPRNRPTSAYAVLGALPGGDPLAAALAAGETPSPELVASAGITGGMHPGVAIACIVFTIASLAWRAAVDHKNPASLHRSDTELALRSTEMLAEAGIARRANSYGGFMDNSIYLERAGRGDAGAKAYRSAHPEPSAALLYWRRWSPTPLLNPDMHNPFPDLFDPVPGPGDVIVLLDADGRLVHLSTMPGASDQGGSAASARGVGARTTSWREFVSAAGYDAARMTPGAPDTSDTWGAADSVTAGVVYGQGAGDAPTTLHAAWHDGRVERFWIDAPWGTSRDPFAFQASTKIDEMGRWLTLTLFTILPILAAVLFAVRNLRAGRGDRRGATKLALFIFFAYWFSHAAVLNVSEMGLGAFLETMIRQAPVGHALLHGVIVWFLYMALEPYLRRLWPRVLVSWARLTSGRLRDPMIGRDILVAFVFVAVNALVSIAVQPLEHSQGPERLAPALMGSLSGIGTMLAGIATFAAGSPQIVMAFFTLLLIGRIVLRSNVVAIVVAVLFIGGFYYLGGAAWGSPLAAAISTAVGVGAFAFLALRFGFLAALIGGFLVQVAWITPWTTQLSAWFSGRMLLVVVLFGALMIYGLVTALGGRALFKDPIGEGM